ncbi:MAG: beta-galactosidase [Clostridiales bacterium]|nr:beta-galactosidase [Clostridiales bacterium]
MSIPREEHPRKQLEHENWINLNGEWQFEIDNSKSGEARGLQNKGTILNSSILVPFCPESKLSGVEHKDFMYGVWYKRNINVNKNGERFVLHFGAVDYEAKVFVNGIAAGVHRGGYTSFSFDITDLLSEGENEITVYATDDTRNPLIPSGKQSNEYNSYGCLYTRTTGIWQTVWLEIMPREHINNIRYFPNINDPSITLTVDTCGIGDLECNISYNGEYMGRYSAKALKGKITFNVPLKEKHLWEVGCGRLYDVELKFGNDNVKSYFGLREVSLDGHKFRINGKSVFQRLILDQGFYPDGIYTAPTDDELKGDIERSMALGFNGARLHEKIFEERFLYHADRLGYMVWGEYPDWGLDHSREDNIYSILPEWIEAIKRDINHPSIIGWCPHNETWGNPYLPAIALIYEATKAIDPTRPCIDTSGGYHVKTDIYCVHNYDQDYVKFKADYDRLMSEGYLYDSFAGKQQYRGEAVFVSEYGGIAWNLDSEGWGYGTGPKSLEEFYERYKGLTDALLDNAEIMGLCYTQLTDIEQEQNGLYKYDRTPKFDTKRMYDIMSRKAAIED